ncbi:MAG: DUF427 domain-containing protein [Egibacteraceae bacterium]
MWHSPTATGPSSSRATNDVPPDSVRWEHLVESPATSWCWWKGKACYLSITIDDHAHVDAAWYYPKPWPLARRIAGHVAFGPGVEVTVD